MIKETILGQKLSFNTSNEVFAKSSIDRGILAMLSVAEFKKNDKVLDLGCGYGVVGITAGKIIGEENVVMCDLSTAAIKLARANAAQNELPNIKIVKSDGLEKVEDNDFTMILSKPPYQANFSVSKNFIERGHKKLLVGGKMIMVTKSKEWYKDKFISTFGGVKIHEVNGYFIFVSVKRAFKKDENKENKSGLSKKLQRKLDNSKTKSKPNKLRPKKVNKLASKESKK